jgi:hypothetical protein
LRAAILMGAGPGREEGVRFGTCHTAGGAWGGRRDPAMARPLRTRVGSAWVRCRH